MDTLQWPSVPGSRRTVLISQHRVAEEAVFAQILSSSVLTRRSSMCAGVEKSQELVGQELERRAGGV